MKAKIFKAIHIAVTIFVMLAVSRFAIRIVDATVQIDNDIVMLIMCLIVANALIGMLSYILYTKWF